MKLVKRIILGVGIAYIALCALMYFNQEKLLFHPYHLGRDFEFKFPDRRFTEGMKVMPNGDSISYLTFYGDSPVQGVIVYFHGNGECIDHTGNRIPPLTKRGYDVVMMDYPGYGKSTGTIHSIQQLFDIADSFVAMAKAKYYPDNTLIYGFSLGTGIAAHAARDTHWYKALLLEAPYYSIMYEAQHRYPFIPVGWLCRYPINTYQYLRDIAQPVYMIHGTEDWIISQYSSAKLMDIHNNNLHRTLVQRAGHVNLPSYGEYDRWLDTILIR